MSKPDWKDAPGLANWLAQDLSGKWFWYECEPKPHFGIFCWVNQVKTPGAVDPAILREAPVRNNQWDKTLERRP